MYSENIITTPQKLQTLKRSAGRRYPLVFDRAATKQDDIIYSRDGKCATWRQDKHFWRLQIEDQDISKRLKKWGNIQLTAWGVNCYVWVFMVPVEHLKTTLKALNFPPRKRSKAQQKSTERLAKNYGGAFKDKLTPGKKNKRRVIVEGKQNKPRPEEISPTPVVVGAEVAEISQ